MQIIVAHERSSHGVDFLIVGSHRGLKLNGSHVPKAMSLPVRPPTLLKTTFTLCAAPLKAGPAEEVTLERPSEAFDVIFDAASFDLAAVFEAACAASEVVEVCRKVFDRATKRVCRSIRREAGVDMKRALRPRDTVVETKIAKKKFRRKRCYVVVGDFASYYKLSGELRNKYLTII